jgi:hypothetical protein
MWFDTNDSTLNVYYDDGTSEQWITTSGPAGPAGPSGAFTDIFESTTTEYTLSQSDSGQTVLSKNSSANTINIPNNSSVPYTIGTKITIIQTDDGVTSVTGLSGVTVNGTVSGTVTGAGRWQSAVLLKINTNEWTVSI